MIAAMAVVVTPALQALPVPAQADQGLAVGACVTADKRTHGRIVQVLPYGYVVQEPGPHHSPMTWPFSDVVASACPAAPNTGNDAPGADAPPAGTPATRGTAPLPAAAGGGACFPNDRSTGSGLQQRVHAALVRGFSHEPQPGEDGRITVHVRKLAIGASHPASPVDQVQYQTVAGRTIYDVRTTFETCTDYNRRSVFITRERNFVCFTKASGVFDCSMTGNTLDLAHDVKREVPK